jgi:hypothetical protein
MPRQSGAFCFRERLLHRVSLLPSLLSQVASLAR